MKKVKRSIYFHLEALSVHSPTVLMENQIDRTIRLMAVAAGLVSFLVFVVFQILG